MELIGKIKELTINPLSRRHCITFELEEGDTIQDSVTSLVAWDRLAISVSKFRRHRSLDANGFLWKCLGEMASAIGIDKWDMYLTELHKYGKFTYIIVKPNAVEAVKRQWRECEVVGNVEIKGQAAVQMICYYGSSTYDSEEFSRLLEGVVSDMKEMGLQPPPSREMQRVIERMKEHEEHSAEK